MTGALVFLGIAAFVFGLVVGSFLNVCIYRLPREESLVYPPSHCPKCYQPIRPEDNIPVVSWFLLRRKCRACGLPISFIYPAVELLTGVLFAFYFWRFTVIYMPGVTGLLTTRELLYYGAFYLANVAFISALFVATVIDFKFLIIPDAITLPGAAVAALVSFAYPQLHLGAFTQSAHPHLYSLVQSLLGAAIGAGIIYGLGVTGKILLGKEAMGFGDVKLMALIGAFLGWEMVLFVILLSALFGTIYGLVHLAVTGDSRIPYGPFLSAAAVISLISKPEISDFLEKMVQAYRFLLR